MANPTPVISEHTRINGNGITHLFIESFSPLAFTLVRNETVIPSQKVDGLLVYVAPDDGTIQGTVSYRETMTSPVRQENLFPGAFCLFGNGRRIEIGVGNNEVKYVWLGQTQEGIPVELESGLKSLQVMVEGGILATKAVWTDGLSEEIIPAPGTQALTSLS